MKYYIGYYNKPWDKSEFTVICVCPREAAADFILSQYINGGASASYIKLTAEEIMNKKLVF